MKKHIIPFIITSLLLTMPVTQTMDFGGYSSSEEEENRRPIRSSAVDEMLLDALRNNNVENAVEALRQGANPDAQIIRDYVREWQNEGGEEIDTLNAALAQYQAEQNPEQR